MAQHNQYKPATLNDLAVMINQGFTEAQRHVDARIDEVKQIQQDLLDEMTATHEDVRYLRRSVDMLVRNDAAQDAAIKTLTARVHRLEKKVGPTN
jgi:hypothetical protein